MYYDTVYDNDHLKIEMEQADGKAAQTWRFRHLKSIESRVLSAVLGSVRRFLRRVFHPRKSATDSVLKQPSY